MSLVLLPFATEMFDQALVVLSPTLPPQREALGNVVLCGGGSLLPGLGERIQADLEEIVPPSRAVRCTVAEDAENASWIGAAMLGDLKVFDSQWCSRREYDEMGPVIVNKRCVTG